MKKTLLTIIAFFLISLSAIPFVSASPLFHVDIKGVSRGWEPISITAGENVPIEVFIKVMEDIEDVYARAEFKYSGGKITALSSAFDLVDNSSYVLEGSKGLYLGIPQDIILEDGENEDLYILVQLEDDDGDVISSEGVDLTADFKIILQRETNKIKIQNATMPNVFKAGERSLVTATIKNLGTNIQSNLYAQLTVSRLGILSKEDIGSIEEAGDEDDTATVDIPLILPDYTESGTYTLELKVFNDYLSTSYIKAIDVDGVKTGVKFTEVIPKDVILNVEQDDRAVFRISILNLGTETQTYDVSLAENVKDWGTVQIEPDRVTLEENEKKIIEVFVSPNRETLGEQVFTTTIKSDNDVVEELKLVADVQESELKLSTINPFLLSLIVAAIILVVILIGMFGARLKGEFKSRMKALMQVSQARDIGREEAKEEITNMMHDMMHTIMGAKEHEKENLTEKAANRVSKIIHPLRGEEVNDVMINAVNKLSDKEGIEADNRNQHKIEVRNHAQKIIEGVLDRLKEKEEVDDVVHQVASKIEPEELGPEGVQSAITTLEGLREKLGNEVEQIEEEEEVIRKGKAGKKEAGKTKAKKGKAKKVKGKKAVKKTSKKGKAVKKVKGKTVAKKVKKKPAKKLVKKKSSKKVIKAKPKKVKVKEKPSLVEKVTTRTIKKY